MRVIRRWTGRIKDRMLDVMSLLIIFLPSFLKIPSYRWIFGYRIGGDVVIGLSWIRVGTLCIGDHVRIGHLNRFKNVPEAEIGDYTTIGNGNTFTSTGEFTDSRGIARRGNNPALSIGAHVGITLLHYFDVQDSLTIGAYTTVGGRGSMFVTHYLDTLKGMQSCEPIRIGRYCMIGSNARFTPERFCPTTAWSAWGRWCIINSRRLIG